MNPTTLVAALLAVSALIFTLLNAAKAPVPLWIGVLLLCLLALMEVFLPGSLARP